MVNLRDTNQRSLTGWVVEGKVRHGHALEVGLKSQSEKFRLFLITEGEAGWAFKQRV